MLTKKEAIEGSIKKWRGIINETTPLSEVHKMCHLCDYSDERCGPDGDRCGICPLGQIEKCVSHNRGLTLYQSILNLSGYMTDELRDLCEQMLARLISLREEEDES